jgi:aspartyl-tRNA(Asn)/glutamyl-tRNA(Gln) amidotransferase subunit B
MAGNDLSPQNKYFEEILQKFEPCIGLEIHCQLKTATKLFCACKNDFGGAVNVFTCPVCMGHPGTLPVLNSKAVALAVRFAKAVCSDIDTASLFARKQYFYPDLPKGYQITQHDRPFAMGGHIALDSQESVALHHIHLEEDAGKLIHQGGATLMDYNRAGSPLIEIVTLPVIHSPTSAALCVKRIRQLARYLEVSDGNMEEGSIRCDVNVSLRRIGERELGTKCEIKNLNSIRNVDRAIQYEILRQGDMILAGEKIVQSTMSFDAVSGRTEVMRTKEEAKDYRYFSDPDLGCLVLAQDDIAQIEHELPKLPLARQQRYAKQFQLTKDECEQLTEERDLANYFETLLEKVGDSNLRTVKLCANWMTTELLKEMNARKIMYDQLDKKIPVEWFSELMTLLSKKAINQRTAKDVFRKSLDKNLSPGEVVQRENLLQISNPDEIKESVSKVLDDHKVQVDEYLAGKTKVFQFFFGQIMKENRGRWNPDLLKKMLEETLEERRKS